MRLLWAVVLVIAAALGGAAHGWWQERSWWTPPVPLRPELPVLTPWSAAEVQPPGAALERPLLWSSRRPPPPPRQPSEEDRLLEELNRATLIAVVQSGERRVALLRLAGGAVVRYGESSHPWRLESFDGRTASFVSAGGLRTTRPLAAVGTRPAGGR